MYAMDYENKECVNIDNVISIRCNKNIVEAQAVNGKWIILGIYEDEETAKDMFLMLCVNAAEDESVLMDATIEGDEDDE